MPVSENVLELPGGHKCDLHGIRRDLIPNYYLPAFPKSRGEPSSEEATKMLKIGMNQAQELALLLLGDREAFSVIYSGYTAKREKGRHVRIGLLGDRWRKVWLCIFLAGKNLQQALGPRRDDAPRAGA